MPPHIIIGNPLLVELSDKTQQLQKDLTESNRKQEQKDAKRKKQDEDLSMRNEFLESTVEEMTKQMEQMREEQRVLREKLCEMEGDKTLEGKHSDLQCTVDLHGHQISGR